MKFTYQARVFCSGMGNSTPGCKMCIEGEFSLRLGVAESAALFASRQAGWLQIGEDVWCPACAQARQGIEAIERNRAGRWVPRHGMRVVYVHRGEPVPAGHRQSAGEQLKEGAVYTIAGFNWADTQLMIAVEGLCGMFFNVELFEPVPQQSEQKETEGAKV